MFRLLPIVNLSTITRSMRLSRQLSTSCYCLKRARNDDDEDGPIKFSTSPARQYRAETTRKGYIENRLWYEPYVILCSLTVFMIYFFILREENDIDRELERTLYSRIEGLEEFQLKQSLEYNRQHNLDTTDIIRRLRELEMEKRQQTEDESI
ncbi:unnamed protein product [Callosobruchus maculatus]|uniref:Uncharacterized protein n=1 Tax=Callosobruchus maculatus TaxID=64391 RepID=A0A653BUT9_CALMS|nr:unnamed protein product [Callosobruchus maculatus]